MQYFIMDVFTREKYSGNQLAVVFAQPELSVDWMQTIAREFNFSETTFILNHDASATPDNPVRVRIFTPTRELPFAGHPVLGTACVLRNRFDASPPEKIVLELNRGPMAVEFQRDADGHGTRGYMTQQAPEFGGRLEARMLADVLGLGADDFAPDVPALEVSTGVPFLLARLRSLDAVKRARLNKEAYTSLFRKLNAHGLHIHALETYGKDNDVNCRMFAPDMGVDEDPATGSAAGCLAGFMRRVDGRENRTFELRVEQGYEINRPSLLFTGFQAEAPGPRVGGYAVVCARGELF